MSDWRAPNLEALCGSFLIITSVSVYLRFHARRKQEQPWKADDWLILVALLTFVGTCICIFIGIHYKTFGTSSFKISAEVQAQTRELGENLLTAVTLISYANLGFTKLSALTFYKRLFDVPGLSTLSLRLILWTSILVVACWLVTFEVLFGFQCGTHYTALWSSVAAHEKYCVYSYPSLEGLVISDVILDIWVILLPIPWVRRYVLSKTRKLAVSGLFLLSLVGLAASIARMAVSLELIEIGPVQAQKEDPRRIDSRLYFYFILESGMAILAINLPVIAFVVMRMIPDTVMERLSNFSHSLTSFATRSSKNSRRNASVEEGLSQRQFNSGGGGYVHEKRTLATVGDGDSN